MSDELNKGQKLVQQPGTRGGIITGRDKEGNPIYAKRKKIETVGKPRITAVTEHERGSKERLKDRQRKKIKRLIEERKKTNEVKKAKEDYIKLPKKELIDEHKKLVNVLESPSKKDDKKEAKKQKKELKEYAKSFIESFKKKA